MQFNSHSDNDDIVSSVADSVGVNTTADLKLITRKTNEAQRIIWGWIFESYGGWQYNDGNHTDLPTATAALVEDQSKYTIPTDALTVRQVEVKDSSGNWHDVDPITLEQIHQRQTENEFLTTSGQPLYYRLTGNVIEIYPAPNYGQAASIRVHYDRGSVSFASTDTTQTPGFASEFHGAVVVGAAYFIAADRTLQNVRLLQARWNEYEQAIRAYYSARFAELAPEKWGSHFEDPAAQLI